MYKRGENDGAPYPWHEIEEAHHPLSRSGPGDDEARATLSEIYPW